MATASLRTVLGLPNVAGRRAALASAVIDSLGSGMFLPFAVIYFLRTTTLSLSSVGAGLSLGSLVVIGVVPLAGLAVDHFGPARAVVGASLLQAAGFLAYLWVATLGELVAAALVIAAGRRLFWTANGALVALLADPSERTRWFSLLRALRNGGFAAGGGIAAAAAAVDTPGAYHALVAGNAASFALAALLMTHWHRTTATTRVQPPASSTDDRRASRHQRRRSMREGFGYRTVFTNRPFLLLLATNFGFVLCGLVIDFLLTVYTTSVLHRPAWLASLLFTLNGVLVVATQTILTRRIERHRPTGMLHLAATLWATAFLLLWAAAAMPTGAIVPSLILAVLLITAAEIVCMPLLNTLALSLAPAEQQGRYFAIQGLTWIGPQALAPALFTWLLAQGTAWPWITLLAVSAATTAILVTLRRALPTGADQPEPNPPVIKSAQ
jgi:Na+/melibiose symporter-like transporter